MTERRDLDIDAIRTTLVGALEELREAARSAAGDADPVTLDQTSVGRLSRMDALQVQAMAKAVGTRRRLRESQIVAALARIDSGDYGYCDACGEPIPAGRLEIDPTALRCVDCAGAR